MLRYQSSRHRSLMQESEQALEDAAASRSQHDARIAKHILDDSKIYNLWESQHADMLLPVAEYSSRTPQLAELRKIEVSLVHRRALVEHMRRNEIVGSRRDKLFSRFYGPRENVDAILAEHRQYMLAVSSRVSTDHLIDIMRDANGNRLLDVYERAYNAYFDLYCFVECSEDSYMSDVVRPALQDASQRAKRIRSRLITVKPEHDTSSFDRQAALARSGRYPVLNYQLT